MQTFLFYTWMLSCLCHDVDTMLFMKMMFFLYITSRRPWGTMAFGMHQERTFSFHSVLSFCFSLFDLSGPRSVFLNISPWPGSFLPHPHPLNPVCHPFLLHLIPSSSGLILTPPQLGRIPFTRLSVSAFHSCPETSSAHFYLLLPWLLVLSFCFCSSLCPAVQSHSSYLQVSFNISALSHPMLPFDCPWST